MGKENKRVKLHYFKRRKYTFSNMKVVYIGDLTLLDMRSFDSL